jgi:hypothetical protein
VDDISVGSVVQPDWDSRAHRILLMDQIQVLYDVWWSHAHEWGFSTLSGEGHYYCLPTGLLRGRSTVLRSEPLTDIERAIHRPDLPLRLLRSPSMQWSKDQYQDMSRFIAAHQADIEHLRISDDDVALDAPEVFLAPFGPGGRIKRGVRLKALNGRNFSSIELLWRAYAVQAPQLRTSTNGIGIYRAGFKSKAPAFYLWGADDMAGHTALAEGRDPLKSGGTTDADRRESLQDAEESYADRLNRWRNNLPFSDWRTNFELGLEQYTQANCDQAERILKELVDGLIKAGEAAPEAKKVILFKTAVEALNALNAETNMIETGEREELCELFNLIAVDCGIDPSKYGSGEGLASEWRDW